MLGIQRINVRFVIEQHKKLDLFFVSPGKNTLQTIVKIIGVIKLELKKVIKVAQRLTKYSNIRDLIKRSRMY